MKGVDLSQLPEGLKKGHSFILKSTENMDNWKAYEQGEATRKAIDLIFEKMGEFLSKQKETVKKQETKKSEKPSPRSETETTKTNPIRERVKSAPVQETESAEFVERIPDEIRFIRRCVSLHGKKKTREDLLRFINALHRAILEKRIRKASPYAKQINYIQDKLVKRYNEMGRKAETMLLSNATLNEFKEIIASQKVMPSVNLIKRYISLNGKFDVKDRAASLLKAMNKALEKGKVKSKDRYYGIYEKMIANLHNYIKNKSHKILSIEETELNGLNGILGHCGCKSLKGLQEEVSGLDGLQNNSDSQVMNSLDFKKMEFKTLGFTGKYLKLIGDPSKGFSAMVFGRPKMGKSFLCIDFAGYLARNHGKVLYVAKEEGLDYTLQVKLNATDVAHPNLDVTSSIPENLSGYDFVFLDSVNRLELSAKDLESLKENYPDISFIQIFQTTKMGSHKGRNDAPHNVDVVIEVPEKGRAVQFGRFNQGGEMDIFPNENVLALNGKPKSTGTGKDKILYDILSPDGFTIRMPGVPLFKTREEGIANYQKWKKRFETQGYYSSSHGRILLVDLDDECTWEEVPTSKADSWLGFRQR